MRKLLTFLVALLAVPAAAQDYGGGWAVNTMDISTSIGSEVIASEGGLRAAGIAPRGSSRRAYESSGVFAGALRADRSVAPAETGFRRSAQVEKIAQRNILEALAERQPDAVDQYEKVFRTQNSVRAFNSVAGPYGLRANDAADTLTAYWIMGWVVANRAALPAPATVAAVRAQVGRGYARSPVARFDAEQRQVLADEAIFNFLVLNQAWRQTSRGGPDQRRLADATQRNFNALGADLRALRLTRAGFVQR